MLELKQFYHFIKFGPSSKIRLLFLFRYSSLILTSFFYLLVPQSPMIFKIGVVVLVGISAGIITTIQRRYVENNTILKFTVLAETIGLTLLLIPTGGISSLFIWYALNPVLIAASFLTSFFCWASLSFYLSSATFIGYHFFQNNSFKIIIEEKAYFYLVCLLTVLLSRLFSQLTKELDAKATLLKLQQKDLLGMNNKLTEVNERYQLTLEHVMSMYTIMENFSTNKNLHKVTEEITKSLINCTQCDAVFYWIADHSQQKSYITNRTPNENLEFDLKKDWNRIRTNRGIFTDTINNEYYLMKVIRTSEYVGVFGVSASLYMTDDNVLLNSTFNFLTKLSEIMIERIHLDQIMEQMIVIEEQNRIANEIHDSVSQRLFGIVCTLHSLQVKGKGMKWEEMNQEYLLLEQSANTTIKELRSVIHCLSVAKKGEEPFLICLKKYLEEFSKLNDVSVKYHIIGDETFITDKLKKGLYRIICEACGNSVRHGASSIIELNLSLLEEKIVLRIQDDGIGMHSNFNETKKEKGIGLLNMQSIVSSFDGTFSIEGIHGSGTDLQIEIPNKKMQKS